MATYYMNDGAFELPDAGFEDLTVHRLRAPLPGGEEIGLVIARAQIPEGKSLREVVQHQLQHEATHLPGHAVISSKEGRIAGAPAMDVRCRYRRENEAFYARQIHVAAFDTWIAFVMSGPITEREACDRHLESVVSSLRLRGD
ncbi:MAG: DcrB-related protein [Minicystis sp.]